MKLFYTMGGGIGHLYRVFIFINQFKIKDFRILTSNQLVYKLFEPANILFVSPETYPSEAEHFFSKNFLVFPARAVGVLKWVGNVRFGSILYHRGAGAWTFR